MGLITKGGLILLVVFLLDWFLGIGFYCISGPCDLRANLYRERMLQIYHTGVTVLG